MSISAVFSRMKKVARQRRGKQIRRKLPNLLCRSDFFDSLEQRRLLASFSYSGTTVTIDLNVANQVMTIAANATAYTFSVANGSTNTWTGTAGSGMTVSGANLTANATALSNFSLFNISDSANNTAVVFSNSGANPYKVSFNITLDNNSNAILFSGNSSFLNSNALTILTDSRVELPSASSLTMANGDLSMNINMQATPRVLNYSGLMVNNGTIQTTGTGLTMIVARGGMGASSSYLNKGVAVITGGKISGGTTGTLSITGYGYDGQSATSTTLQGQGVFVYNAGGAATSTITSLGANVSVTGFGANDTNSNLVGTASSLNLVNAGVMIGGPGITSSIQGGLITSGGNGTVTVTGYGGTAANQVSALGVNGIYSYGVSLIGSNASIRSGGAGLVTVTGYGGGAVANTPFGTGVNANSGQISSGANGSVVVNGTGCTTVNSANHYGVFLQGATGLIAAGAGSGTTTVTGQGGGCGSLGSTACGIYTTSGATISALGNGNVTVTGTGGPGSGNVNYGVQISAANTTITSNGGEVLVTGTGGGSTVSSTNTGVSLSNGATITAGGTANVTVYGYGGNNSGTSGNSNHGVQLSAGSSGQVPDKITSSGGNVIVTGTGGGGNANSSAASSSTTNYGVILDLGSFITAGNNGTVNVTGYGGGRSPGATGGSNYGVYLNSCTTNNNITYFSCITSGGAAVNVTGFGGGGSGTTVPASAGTNHGVYLLAGGVITTGGNAPLTVNGTGGGFGNGTSASNYGVVACGTVTAANIVYRSTITSGGSGNVTLTGTGGGLSSGVNNYGVCLNSGALVTAGGTDAAVTVNGQGGSSSGNTNYGVYVDSNTGASFSTITSGGGNVTVTGCGGLGSAGSNQYGVLVSNGGDITSGLNGSVTVSGTGGTGDTGSTGYGHAGIVVSGSGSLVTSGGTGPVLVTGNGGGKLARFYNHGVIVSSTGLITAGANATVTVLGRAGNNNANSTGGSNYGVLVTGAGSKVTSANGPVLISGYGGMTDPTNANTTSSNYGVYLESGGEASATGSASITVNGGNNTVSLLPTAGTAVDLGTKSAGKFGLVQADLNNISASTLSVGNLNSGNVAVSSNLTYATNLTLTSNQAISGSLSDSNHNFTQGGNMIAATGTVNLIFAPGITTQPTNQSVSSGNSATFSAAATGGPAPTVQWQVNTGSGWANVTDGTGGTTDNYTTANLTSAENSYQYRAVYTNGIGSDAITNGATLTVNSGSVAPAITTQPVNTGVEAGQTASFTAAASGNPLPTVQWEQSPDGSIGWSPVSGANLPTLSFTATVGDNGKYYRAVFTNSAGTATTNAAKLAIGITPVIITVNEITVPVGLTSGMTVIATGSPAPTYSISAGTLPSGVTLDSTTGLFMGTPAAGTSGSWPVTIKAENGIGAGTTQAFSLTVTSTITSFTLSKGQSQRSYIRYLDLGMDSNASALALLINPSRVRLTKADLNGVGSTPVPLTGFLSVTTGQSTLAFDFGTVGLGNSRNTTAADGYCTLGVDLDGNGTFETNLFFFRLFGDTNSDREVTAADQNAVLAGCSQAYNANLDLNGDGVVNTSDYQYVKKSVGRRLKSTLIVTA